MIETRQPRDLVEVRRQILGAIPPGPEKDAIVSRTEGIVDSVHIAAPEMMYLHWSRFAETLYDVIGDPMDEGPAWKRNVALIFAGEEP